MLTLMSVMLFQAFVESELNTVINMSSLAVSQLLVSAQDCGVELTLETSAVENQVCVVNNTCIDTSR